MQNLHLILILLAIVERALLNDLVETKDSDEKPTTICKLFIFFQAVISSRKGRTVENLKLTG
jgi:hypothetical protein